MESLKELYRIGPGPSSSHTIGVQNACLYYLKQYPEQDSYKIVLTGSLALTGKGHMSDDIARKIFDNKNADVSFDFDFKGKHPNTLIFSSTKAGNKTDDLYIYSIGGGAIEVEGIGPLADPNIYKEKNLKEIMDYCNSKKCSIANYVYANETDIKDYLFTVALQMISMVTEGLSKEGMLPGRLHIKKVAKQINEMSKSIDDAITRDKLLVSSYAYASMEQNACGGTVVTSPTLGSCGIVSALVYYYYHDKKRSMDEIINALAVSGVIGNVVKTNATISGAAGGCQAEVGTACAMGAAFASYMEGLSNKQIECAAEIAMEHNLGLTCDPVGGYVQVPCIERNGVGVLRSLDSMMYAKYIGSIKENKVSFDMIVSTMRYTGNKIAVELRETSLGGLAEVVPLDDNSKNC